MPYKNPEDRRRRFKERYHSDPEFRARHNASGRDWAKRNPGRVAAKLARYRDANRDELNERARQRDPQAKRDATQRWRDANREENRRRDRERKRELRALNDPALRARIRADRFRRRGSKPDADAREYSTVLLADPCSYCGSTADTIDHITPLVDGGDSEWSNLTAACAGCNARKNTKPLLLALLS